MIAARLAPAAAMAAAALAFLAAPAGAATVGVTHTSEQVCPDTHGGGCERETVLVQTIRFAAGAGEANDLAVTATADGIRFRDAGASVQAASGCRQDAADSVTCRLDELAERHVVEIALGDGPDRALAAVGARVDGGPGDDVIAGGDGADRLSGGEGSDRVDGGAGDDAVAGGHGDDRLSGGAGDDVLAGEAGADVLDGGADADVARYDGSREPVHADLARGTATQAGATDRLAGIEGVRGGAGADVLRGSSRPDRLDGGEGADRVAGMGGDDVLSGGERSTVEGGSGDDALAVAEGVRRARVVCGAGRDSVATAPRRSALSRSCERGLGAARAHLPPQRRRGGRLGVTLGPCAGSSCSLQLEVAIWSPRARRWIDVAERDAIRLPERRTRRVTLRLDARGRRALRRPVAVRLEATLYMDELGNDHAEHVAVVRLGRR